MDTALAEVAGASTHLEALAWAVSHTHGTVVELGAGWYSTPMLHGLCEGRRHLITIDHDPEWLGRFSSYISDWHTLSVDPDFRLPDIPIDVVLVDHGNAATRGRSIREATKARYIVVHDTEDESAVTYPGVRDELATFTFRRDFTSLVPHTTVVGGL